MSNASNLSAQATMVAAGGRDLADRVRMDASAVLVPHVLATVPFRKAAKIRLFPERSTIVVEGQQNDATIKVA